MRLVQRGLRMAARIIRICPAFLRPLVFEAGLRSRHPVFLVLFHRPRWLAVYKTAEDTRNFDWFQDF